MADDDESITMPAAALRDCDEECERLRERAALLFSIARKYRSGYIFGRDDLVRFTPEEADLIFLEMVTHDPNATPPVAVIPQTLDATARGL